MSPRLFRASLAAIAFFVAAQSIIHLIAVGVFDSTNSAVDLDRSSAIPDVASTAVTAVAAGGAIALAVRTAGRERLVAVLLAVALTMIGVDDVVGVDRDLMAAATLVFVGATIAATAFVAMHRGERRAALALAVGLVALMATLFAGQLPWIDDWFDRTRGDPIIESQIVLRQGLELVGWGLVALGVWDAALGTRTARKVVQP